MQENQATQTENHFLWNDVAAIKDDNCCFIILKSMLELESDGADSVNDAEIVDILGEFNDRELSGKVILELKYEDETKDEQKLQVEVPFLIAYEGDLSRGSVLEENYAHAECADKRHILLETVISVPAQNMPVRALKRVGHFERKSKVTLPEGWPKLSQIIGVNLRYDEGLLRTENEQPFAALVGHIGLIYAQEEKEGERIMYYEADDPFSVALESSLLQTEVGYYALNAQIDENGEVIVQSFNYLYGEKAQEERNEEVIENDEAEEKVSTAEGTVEKRSAPQAKNTRPNCRESLEKHMHRLDSGVKTTQVVRNIEFNK